jgi:hypothetical protein
MSFVLSIVPFTVLSSEGTFPPIVLCFVLTLTSIVLMSVRSSADLRPLSGNSFVLTQTEDEQ